MKKDVGELERLLSGKHRGTVKVRGGRVVKVDLETVKAVYEELEKKDNAKKA